jgi:hypothetical protein
VRLNAPSHSNSRVNTRNAPAPRGRPVSEMPQALRRQMRGPSLRWTRRVGALFALALVIGGVLGSSALGSQIISPHSHPASMPPGVSTHRDAVGTPRGEPSIEFRDETSTVSGLPMASVSALNRGSPLTNPGYFVTFKETGLPNQTEWSVVLNGSITFSVIHTIVFSVSNGTYWYGVGSVAGYSSSPSTGHVSVTGANVTRTIGFSLVPPIPTYRVAFSAIGLPQQVGWEVQLNGTLRFNVSGPIVFSEPNGSYTFQVFPVAGFSIQPSSGSLKVAGNNTTQQVDFTATSGNGAGGARFLGLPQLEGYAVLGGILFLALILGLFLLLRRRRRPVAVPAPSNHSPPLTPPGGLPPVPPTQ